MLKVVKSAGDKVGDQTMAKADVKILEDLSMAAGRLYDGAVDFEGNPVEMGLKREKLPSTNRKFIDGAKVRFAGDKIIVTYESETKLKQVYRNGVNGFQNEMDEMIQKIVDGLKKNYSQIAGKSITLTPEGDESKVTVDYVSRQRTLVQAVRAYHIPALSDVMAATGAEVNARSMTDAYKEFLAQGGFGKRPDNDTRPKDA